MKEWTCEVCRFNGTMLCAKKKNKKCKDFAPNFGKMAKQLGSNRVFQIRMLQGILTQINALQTMKDPEMKETYNELLELTEDVLQRAWNMKADRKWHTYWMKIPDCTCPKLDNVERLGIDNDKIISNDCPYHGGQK